MHCANGYRATSHARDRYASPTSGEIHEVFGISLRQSSKRSTRFMMDLTFPVTWIPLGEESYPTHLHHAKDGAPDEFELTNITLRQILSASNEKEAAWMEVASDDTQQNSTSLRRIYVETNARHVEIYTEGNYFATLIGVPLDSSTKDEPAFCHKLSELIKFSKLRLKFLSIRNSSDDVLLKIQKLKLSDVKSLRQDNSNENISTGQVPNFSPAGMENSTAQLLSLIAQGQKPQQQLPVASPSAGAGGNTKEKRQATALPPSDLLQMKGFLMGEVSNLLDTKLAPLYSRLDRLQSRVEELLTMQLRSEQQRCEDRNIKTSNSTEAQTSLPDRNIVQGAVAVVGESQSGLSVPAASAARSVRNPPAVTAKSAEVANKEEKESPAAVADQKALNPASVMRFLTSIIEVKSADPPAALVSDKKGVVPIPVSERKGVVPVSVSDSKAVVPVSVSKRKGVVPVTVSASERKGVVPVSVSDRKGVVPVTVSVVEVEKAEMAAVSVGAEDPRSAEGVPAETLAPMEGESVPAPVETPKSGKAKKKKNKSKGKVDPLALAVPAVSSPSPPSTSEAVPVQDPVPVSGEKEMKAPIPALNLASLAPAKKGAKAKAKGKASETSEAPAPAAPSEAPASDIPAVTVTPDSQEALKDDMKDLMRLLRGII